MWLRSNHKYTLVNRSLSPAASTRSNSKSILDDGRSNLSEAKSKPGRVSSMLMMINLLFLLFTLFTAALTFKRDSKGLLTLPANMTDSAHQTFDNYIGDIEVFLHDHPNSLADTTTFAQMGLYTRLYARMLQDHTISESLLSSFERSLWYFAPGIHEVRRRHTYNVRARRADSRKQERGIVLPVGQNNFLFACHFIATIRQVHKSDMAVEIVYRDEKDLPTYMRNYLVSAFSNVRLMGLKTTSVFDDRAASAQGWATKAFAVVATKFSQVILADADTVFLVPPEAFFEQEDYKQTGTLFFSDRNILDYQVAISDWMMDQFGERSRGPSKSLSDSYFWQHSTRYRQESGVVVVDKRRAHVFSSLLFTAWQNLLVIRRQVTYALFHGDKESFWLAFELARLPYYMNNHGAGNLGAEHHSKTDDFCGEHPLHFFEAPEGAEPLPNMEETPPLPSTQRQLSRPAWFNGSLRNNKYLGRSTELLDPDNTIWSMDGDWFFSRDAGGFCQKGFTKHGLDEFGLNGTLRDIVRVGERAELAARDYLDSV